MRLVPRRLIAVASAMALSAGLVSIPAGAPAEAAPVAPAAKAAAKSAKTSAVEKRRSKGVKTPKLKWYTCYGYAKCATVKVPLDYDKPKGKKVELAVLKVPARNQKAKIGSLFVNPGGPGGSGTEFAYFSPDVFSSAVTDRFDVVGLDPRGVAFSDNVRCFPSARQNDPVLDRIGSAAFPYSSKQEKAFIKAYDKHAKACSSTGKPLTGAISTAQVARDMDLMRRAVGDKKLTYFGFSYGSYLGEVYANMYPDRVRAVAIDGVLDPVKWRGTKKTQSTPIGARLGSGEGAAKALRRALVLCDQAGEEYCSFAAGNPVANYEKIAARLRKAPLVEVDPDTGEEYVTTYADFVQISLGILYSQSYGPESLTGIASYLGELTGIVPATAPRTQTVRSLKGLVKEVESPKKNLPGKRLGFPYDNSLDAFSTIACTDSRNSRNLAKYPALAKKADASAPYFGRLWLWNLASCSSKKWAVKDEDRYLGSFSRRTASTVLVVGNYWDPATNYAGAVSTAKRMPNSRLLSSNSWGHTAYGTSECATNAVDRYLLNPKRLPAKGTVCQSDYVPFQEPLEDEEDEELRSAAKVAKAKRDQVAIAPVKPGLR